MHCTTLFISLAALSASVAAFTLISPSSSTYWVQFSTNTISWSNSPNDAPKVSLQIINANSTLLNGAFSIAEYVPASLESYTVTNVTLVVADGYIVQMVNPANATQVYASSSPFSVKPNGTAPAPGSTPGSTGSTGGTIGSNTNGGLSGNLTSTNLGASATNSRNASSGFNSNINGTSSKNGANSAASSLVPVSLAALLGFASALGLAMA